MSIESQINRIQGAKDGLKSSIEGKGVEVPSGATLDEYPSFVDRIEDASSLSGDVAENRANIEILSGDVAEIHTEIEALSAITEDIEEEAEVVAQSLSQLNAQVSGNTQAINELATEIEAMSAVTADIEALSGDVADNKTAIEALSGEVESMSAVTTDIESLSGEVADNASAIETLADAIEEVSGATEDINAKFVDYYTSGETESAITSAMSVVTALVYDNERIVAESFMAETARTEQTYLKPTSLNSYATKQYVDDAISGISTSAETQQLINTAMAIETARTEQTYLKPQALSSYYTSGETDTKIDSALTDYMTISQLNEIFSVLEKKPAVIYEYDANNPIRGQSGNLFTATVWHTLVNVDLSNYSRLRVYVNPSSHNVGLSTNNHTSAAIFEISLNDSSLTTNVQYYSGGIVTSCLNNDNRLYSITAMVRNENNAWQIALKTVSLYGTSSTDITDSHIYKIEGIYDSSYNLVNPVTTYSGSGLPNPQDGNNGDLYLQTE